MKQYNFSRNPLMTFLTVWLVCAIIMCVFFMCGCAERYEGNVENELTQANRLTIIVLDSCEYYCIKTDVWKSDNVLTVTHKGNCRFCEERKLRNVQDY